MKELNQLLERLDSLNIPIKVKGTEYAGNNPYLLNKINCLLYAGVLTPEDIEITDPMEFCGSDCETFYVHFPELVQVSYDIDEEYRKIAERE